MNPLMDKLGKTDSPAETKALDTPDQRSLHTDSESLLGELWHTTKYAFIQSPYDAVRQEVNHLAGAISNNQAVVPEHQFVDPVQWRNDFSAVGIAQDIGSAAGSIPYFIAEEAGLKKLLPEKMIAESLPLLADAKTQSWLRAGITGGIIGGALTPVTDDRDWLKNKTRFATTGFITFAVAGAGIEYFGKNQLASRLVGGTEVVNKVAQASLQRADAAAIGAVYGGVGSLVANESGSLIFDHKLAHGSDLTQKSLKSAAMMATLAALRPGYVKTEFEDIEPKSDAKQAMRLEKQAAQLAGKGQFGGSAHQLSAALDCLEAAKAQGLLVDEGHLAQLYRTLAHTTLQADQADQSIIRDHR